jgi:NAD(P)-dependent dehydrogenase (short-subunit alcohol dehydrogenase family)
LHEARALSGKIWFLTGCSRGFGRAWAESALERGDKVAATPRDDTKLESLAEAYPESALVLPLDVTQRCAVFDAVRAAHRHFGRLDIVVNNTGYALLGAVEAVDEGDAHLVRHQLFRRALGDQVAVPLKRSPEIAAYDEARCKLLGRFDLDGIGDPAATPAAIFRLVDADEPPIRLMLGKSVLDTTHAHYEARLATWEAWAGVSGGTRRQIPSGRSRLDLNGNCGRPRHARVHPPALE